MHRTLATILLIWATMPIVGYAGVSSVTLGFRYYNDTGVKQRVFYTIQEGASEKSYDWYSAAQRDRALQVRWWTIGTATVDVNPGQTVTYTGTMPRLAREDETPPWTAFLDGRAYVFNRTEALEAPNRAPSISWYTAPGSVASGQSYTVRARGEDPDGNLSAVRVWKESSPFAFSGGGNGWSNVSDNNGTSDTGPRTITFYAEALDNKGASSGRISHRVTINAPVNNAPTISISAPSSVSSGATYSVSATGRDSDGNLIEVTLYKDGSAFASRGGSLGGSYTVSNPTSDSGPKTVRYSAIARDSGGRSASTATNVTVNAPPVPTYTLSVRANSGGSASGSASGLPAGTRRSISASASSGYHFTSWSKSGAGSIDSTSSASTAITMGSGNMTVTASFASNAPTTYSLRIEAGTNISASVNWGGRHYDTASGAITITGLTSGTVVSGIQAGPNSGYVFDYWQKRSGSGNFTNSSQTASYQIGSGDATIKCFSKSIPTYTLTVNSTSGGSASGSASGLTSGTVRNISASASSGYLFNGWTKSGAGSIANASNASTTYTMGAGNATVTANFTPGGAQSTVSSAGGTITLGQSFTPPLYGGNGSGAEQVRWGSGSWQNISAYTPAATGNYTFYVRKLGDGSYNTSNVAGPYTLVVNKANQAAVSSAGATITFGESFTATATGGSGTGAYQIRWGASGTWVAITTAFTPPAAGNYTFYVRRLGDASYNTSAIAGPYTLVVNKAKQAPVTSAGGTIQLGESFTPVVTGGSGTGAYQVSWPSISGAWSAVAPITPGSAGSYVFQVRRLGDSNYDISSIGGPYTLNVVAPIPTNIKAKTNPTIEYDQWFTPSDTTDEDFMRLP